MIQLASQTESLPTQIHIGFPRWIVATATLAVSLAVLLAVCMGQSDRSALIWTTAIVAACVLGFCRIEQGLYFYFIYLFFDGALKINSNYDPIIHIAQDLLLIILAIRSATDTSDGGFYKFRRTPHYGFFLILICWIAVQYLNPFGLGVVPSIAGSKVYLSAPILFALIYHHVPAERVRSFFKFLLILASVQGAMGCCEYLWFQDGMIKLNSFYRVMTETKFAGVFYRPFGSTPVPGGPSVWIFLAAPIAAYLASSRFSTKMDRCFAILFFALAVPCLIFCQVRVSILIAALSVLAVGFHPSPGLFKRLATTSVFGVVAACLIFFYFNVNSSDRYSWVGGLSRDQREALYERINTLTDHSVYVTARTGALQESLELASRTVNGIGLSRVGAASEPWSARIEADPYFGPRWSFADNLFRALFTELGIFGLISWLLLTFVILKDLFRQSLSRVSDGGKDHLLIWTCASSVSILILSGLGSEGIVYNPVSSVLWTCLALGMKEAHRVAS